MRKPYLYIIGSVFGLIIFLALVKYLLVSRAIAQHANMAQPPETVTTIIAQEVSWTKEYKAVGSIVATQGVVLRSESAGEVAQINFESGDQIEAGKVLLELDNSVEDANLKAAVALAEQKSKALNRVKNLMNKNSMAQAELETAEAEARESLAAVDSLKATVQRRKIIAPFSGRAGIRKVNLGDFIEIGKEVVPLFSLDPLFVNFTLPERMIPDFKPGLVVRLTVDAYPDKEFEGTLTTVNPLVDADTRNVELQATVSNPNEELRPGMFANVKLVLPQNEQFIVIPSSSINYAPYGNTIYIVEEISGPDGAKYKGVRQQVVTLGQKRGDQIAVLTGLKPGEEVVTSGVFKLRPAAHVAVNNQIQPGNNPAPKPEDT